MSVAVQIGYLLSIVGAIAINLYLLHIASRHPDQVIMRYLMAFFVISIAASISWLGLSLAQSKEVAFFWTRLRLIILALVGAVLSMALFHRNQRAAPPRCEVYCVRHPR